MDIGVLLTSAVVAVVMVMFGVVFGNYADRFVRRTLRENFVERSLAAGIGKLVRWVIWFWSFFGAANIFTSSFAELRTLIGPIFNGVNDVVPHLISLAEWLVLIVVLAHLLGRPDTGGGER